ncbi:T9SS type A sorting domain-containing protein [Thermoflexibacter ruber]|nr:T9SS type A sorting domain-containing protein [Thermoflexibacter ruber]
MKKLITSIILFVSFSQCIYSQEYAVYSSNKQKTILTVSPEKVLVWFVPNLTEDRKKQTLAKISLNGLLASNDEMPHTRILSLKEDKTADDAIRLVKDLLKEESVLYASPVLVGPEGTSLGGLTNELIVKLKKTTSLAFLEQLAKAKNIEKIVQYEYDPLVYILTINKHSSTHTLDLSNQFLETGKFEFAHPNYHLFIKTATSDPYFNLQWNVKNTGQVVNLITGTVGEDIKVEQAWNISTGSGINLAVIYNGSFISSTPNSQNIDQVEWQSLSSSVYVSQSGITATAYLSNGCVGGIANMRVRVRNICGLWSDWRMFTVNVCSNSGFRFVYSPNPTSDILDITAVPTEENKNLTIAAKVDFEAKLLDQDGKVVREGKNQNKEKKISFDVKGLKEGTYYLHILYGKEIEKHQIIISKSASTN